MTATLDRPPAAPPAPDARPRRRIVARPGVWLMWGILIFFFVNLFAAVGMVVVRSFAGQWFGTWWPTGDLTTKYYSQAWIEADLWNVMVVTFQVAAAVVVVSVLIGVPAAYALARRDFPFKRLTMLLFLLPIMVPPIAYGIPLATVLYKFQLAGTITGVVLANLVPSVPFVVLTMTPFIEQIDPKIESAARMCGATTRAIFVRILLPLLVPGMLAAAILVLVRTVGMFELTYLTSGFGSQTLIVALYAEMSAAGIRPPQRTDAMAVMYMLSMAALLIVALRFVNPTQLVTRVADPDKDR